MSKKSGLIVIGVDEAGRGAWAGPVCAAAFAFSGSGNTSFRSELADSKTLSEPNREKLYEKMHSPRNASKFFSAVCMQDNTVIDTAWIREANRLAMEVSIRELLAGLPPGSKVHLKIDGRDNYRFDLGAFAEMVEEIEYIVRGDSKIKEIMAASILAKVSRDRHMREVSKKYPEYRFEKHKGYGTKTHQDTLSRYGVSTIHRTSYAPIRLRAIASPETHAE